MAVLTADATCIPLPSPDQVLVEGNPALTQEMVNQRIAVWEVFLEVKIGPEQRGILQRALMDAWKRGDQVEIQGTLDDDKVYGKESEILVSRAANQPAFVDSLRKQPDEPVARQLLELYDAAHPERKNVMRNLGLADLVGDWKRADAILATRLPNSSTYVGVTATDTLTLNIFPDGHFKHFWSHSHCEGLNTCCHQYGTDVNGAISLQGKKLVLTENSGSVLMRDACVASQNYFKPMNQDPQVLDWELSHPSAGASRLCVSDRPFGFNFDHKAPPQAVCYEKQK